MIAVRREKPTRKIFHKYAKPSSLIMQAEKKEISTQATCEKVKKTRKM
jgi:hypothetical protein